MTQEPLANLRVLEVGDLGEVAGKLLADSGADVIRVEPLSGASSRRQTPFVQGTPGVNNSLANAFWNTNKRSIAMDLTNRDGGGVWRDLVRWADIVVDGTGLGILDENLLGRDQFIEQQQLIWCSITHWGLTGPRCDWRANDLVSMAHGGIVMMCGYDDHRLPPVLPDRNHSLAIAGEYAVVAILAALLQRSIDLQGQLLDVSIHEAVAGTTEGAFMNWEYLRRNPSRTTGRHAGTPERWQLQSADGDFLVLFGGGVPRDRAALDGLRAWMDEYGCGGVVSDPSFESLLFTPPSEAGELRTRFASEVADFVSTRPTEEVYRKGQEIGMPWAPVRLPEENLDDPHWEDRQVWVEANVTGSSQPVRYPRVPYGFGGTPSFRSIAPELGQHTEQILVETLGYSNESLEELERRNVILLPH